MRDALLFRLAEDDELDSISSMWFWWVGEAEFLFMSDLGLFVCVCEWFPQGMLRFWFVCDYLVFVCEWFRVFFRGMLQFQGNGWRTRGWNVTVSSFRGMGFQVLVSKGIGFQFQGNGFSYDFQVGYWGRTRGWRRHGLLGKNTIWNC